MLPQSASVPERSSMGNIQNTATAKRAGARRSIQTIVAAIALSALAFPANGQGAILNDFQRQLLALEEETKEFHSVVGDFLGIQAKRAVGGLRYAELAEIKGTAETLLLLARELQAEANDLRGGALYTEPGVELDTETLYRISANELALYFGQWHLFLLKVVTRGEVASPFDFWSSPDDEAYTRAQIYRQLANIQYRLDQLEAE